MLKHCIAGLALFGLAGLATAQNAGEIARVQNGESCPGCNLFQAELSYLDLSDVDVSGARLRQANMQLSTFDHWSFENANLSVANLFGTRFNRADFTNANLQAATLVGAYLGHSTVQGMDLTGANISGADLSDVKGLTQSQLEGACGDPSTKLPSGLSVASCD